MSDPFLAAAVEEAHRGLAEGGIPIGSVLVIEGEIVGRGHNRRVQEGSVIKHADDDTSVAGVDCGSCAEAANVSAGGVAS